MGLNGAHLGQASMKIGKVGYAFSKKNSSNEGMISPRWGNFLFIQLAQRTLAPRLSKD
jgi:hypothetical protein